MIITNDNKNNKLTNNAQHYPILLAVIKIVPDISIGLVNVVCMWNKCSAGGKGVEGVREMQEAQGQLTSSKGPVRMGIPHYEQGIPFPR